MAVLLSWLHSDGPGRIPADISVQTDTFVEVSLAVLPQVSRCPYCIRAEASNDHCQMWYRSAGHDGALQ